MIFKHFNWNRKICSEAKFNSEIDIYGDVVCVHNQTHVDHFFFIYKVYVTISLADLYFLF